MTKEQEKRAQEIRELIAACEKAQEEARSRKVAAEGTIREMKKAVEQHKSALIELLSK